MATCSRCGKQVGLFSDMCDECKEIVWKDELKKLAEKEAQEALEKERLEKERATEEEYHRIFRQGLIEKAIAEVWSKLEMGERVYLYDNLYLAVDSILIEKKINDFFSIGALRQRGLDGWEVVSAIPRTMGIALTNKSSGSTLGEAWGAGLGGNIEGVHIVLRKEINLRIKDAVTPELYEYLSRYIIPSDVRDLMTK